MFGRVASMDGHGVLSCPECGGENLHQISADVGFRANEDEPCSNLTSVTVNGTKVWRGPIPGRRDALHVGFTCEHCSAVSTLTIMQHKGMTMVHWEDSMPPVEKKAVRK